MDEKQVTLWDSKPLGRQWPTDIWLRSFAKLQPFVHQLEGVYALVRHPYFGLFDEMGVAKSAQAIHAGCLAWAGLTRLISHSGARELLKTSPPGDWLVGSQIHTMLIVCPRGVRQSWLHPEWGELEKHCWIPYKSFLLYQKKLSKVQDKTGDLPVELKGTFLNVVVTNYEQMRSREKRNHLLQMLKGHKIFLIIDESHNIKNPSASQSKGMMELRKKCNRVVELSGTPIGNTPLDLWHQFKVLSPQILPFSSYNAFKNHFSETIIKNGYRFITYKNLEELHQHTAPYVLRRLKRDCLDLPAELEQIHTVTLTPKLWSMYLQMKNDLITWLREQEQHREVASIAVNAMVKILRLRQLTSGLFRPESSLDGDPDTGVIYVSEEKLEFVYDHLKELYSADPRMRVILWSAWRAEIPKLREGLHSLRVPIVGVYGGQPEAERAEAIERFSNPRYAQDPGILIGNPAVGGVGLNLTTCSYDMFVSTDFSLIKWEQAKARTHRSGQKNKVTHAYLIATGPNGEETVDHRVFSSTRDKRDLATYIVKDWRKLLGDAA
jgi:SNF2 family DNA or RNA helicase